MGTENALAHQEKKPSTRPYFYLIVYPNLNGKENFVSTVSRGNISLQNAINDRPYVKRVAVSGKQFTYFHEIDGMTPELAAKGILRLLNTSPDMRPFVSKEQIELFSEHTSGDLVKNLELIVLDYKKLYKYEAEIGQEQFEQIDGFLSYLEQVRLNFPEGLPKGTFAELSNQIYSLSEKEQEKYIKLIEGKQLPHLDKIDADLSSLVFYYA